MEQHNTNSNSLQDDARASEKPSDEDVLARSVFVKNVEYSATVKELEEHFKECGTIRRTKIGVDKATGQPLGYAYIEFEV